MLRKGLCASLSVLAVTLVPVGMPRAEMVPSDAVLVVPIDVAQARTEVDAFLRRADVAAELARLGISAEEADARVAALSDAELLQIHGRLQELPAGQATFVAVVAGTLLVTVTVLVFTDLLGYTDVFPFIKPLPRGEAKP